VRGVMAFSNMSARYCWSEAAPEVNLGQLDAVAAHPLLPRREHARVVLVGGQHLVARLEVEAELAICSDSLALRVMANSSGSQPNSRASSRRHALDVRLQDLPHVVDGRLVRDVEVRLNASCTTRGLGHTPPLFRLMMVRSRVKAP